MLSEKIKQEKDYIKQFRKIFIKFIINLPLKGSKNMGNDNLDKKRHSLAHIMAAAVKELYPETKFAIGPTVENGFYYDFDFGDIKIKEENLKDIEKKMKFLIKQNIKFEKNDMEIDKALEKEQAQNSIYKVELIEDLKKERELMVTYFKTGSFEDLCRGPHIQSTNEIKPNSFKLHKIAGAYWRGNEKNKMLTRIYGLAFDAKEDLDQHLELLKEAEKRDHRRLGKELDLFVFSDLVGPGLPMYTHKGNTILKEIRKYSNELQSGIGYEDVQTPNMNKGVLFKVSGHYEKYAEDMFKVVSNYTDEEYFLKPMNCPQHTQIYASKPRSFRDLPIRISDFANLYRDERPGELSGLTRLRCFCQDDGHCFCREDQIKDEFAAVLAVIKLALKTYSMDYKVRLSLWDPNEREKYLGEPEVWDKSQKMLEEILVENKIDFYKAEGEAALYGPKMDLISKDSLGREWQISTIQLDIIMPGRFGLTYVDSDGTEKTPVMIHRAIVGSPERFLGILIEHYAGAFPVWLSPVQVKIIAVGEDHHEYSLKLANDFKEEGIRVEVDNNDETVGNKIRKATNEKVPYVLVVGDKEMGGKTLSVRDRGKQDTRELSQADLIEEIKAMIAERK